MIAPLRPWLLGQPLCRVLGQSHRGGSSGSGPGLARAGSGWEKSESTRSAPQPIRGDPLIRIAILTLGARGDVQPYVALGRGLQRAGHTVCLATHAAFEDLVRQNGLDFSLVEFNPQALLRNAAGQIWLESGSNPLRFMHRLVRAYAPLVARTLDDHWQASQGAEAIVFSPLALGGCDIAEKLGVPAYLAGIYPPDRPSRYQPVSGFPRLPLGPVYNRLTYVIKSMALGLLRPFLAPVNRWRVERLG